ncbi:MAG: hypothetical protein ACI4WG_00185 [Erysipelotrichaceae bacterium]
MKKIIIALIVLLALFGCKDNTIENPDNPDQEKPEDRIWLVFDYQPLDYDTYYKQQKDFSDNQELIRITAIDEKYSATYGVDIAIGLYVQTFENTSEGRKVIDKQYFYQTKDADSYKAIGMADGYWFYYQKRTGQGDQLIRINYKGDEQVIMENFDLNDCYSICFADVDVLYILKYDSFNNDYNVKLYRIYMNEVKTEEIDSKILNVTTTNRPQFVEQENSYHILYQGENPDYTLKRQYLESNPDVLENLLNKYNVNLKESSPATDQYNDWIYNALIYKEYGINTTAIFDYDITTKELTYKQISTEVNFPVEQDNIYK